jgi:hypothetical protein
VIWLQIALGWLAASIILGLLMGRWFAYCARNDIPRIPSDYSQASSGRASPGNTELPAVED